MGLSADNLQKVNSRLIYCDVSGYGNNGPYRDKKAYDLLIQSEAGFLSVTGTLDQPSKAGNSIADIAAGMYAYSNILAALLLREKTGLGSCIDISMLECLSEWMSFPLYYAMDEATPPPRNAASHATIYPYGPFLAGDGKTVMLGLQNEREWLQFCRQVLLNEALAVDPRFNSNAQRNENRAALEQIILETFRPLNSQQVITRLDQAQIANAKLNDMAGLWQHQQLAARQRWANVESESGTMSALIPPGINNAYDYRMGPIPSVGEHTTTILQELGLSQHEISALRQAGTI